MNYKIFFKILVLVSFLACLSAGSISSRYSNGFDDTATLHVYNGVVSNNFQTIEISRYFDLRSPIKYTLKVNFYSRNPLFISQIYIEADKKKYLLNNPIFTKKKKIDSNYTEILLFIIKEEQIKNIIFSENIFIEFRGKKGKAPFLLLESHKNILKEFYKRVVKL